MTMTMLDHAAATFANAVARPCHTDVGISATVWVALIVASMSSISSSPPSCMCPNWSMAVSSRIASMYSSLELVARPVFTVGWRSDFTVRSYVGMSPVWFHTISDHSLQCGLQTTLCWGLLYKWLYNGFLTCWRNSLQIMGRSLMCVWRVHRMWFFRQKMSILKLVLYFDLSVLDLCSLYSRFTAAG